MPTSEHIGVFDCDILELYQDLQLGLELDFGARVWGELLTLSLVSSASPNGDGSSSLGVEDHELMV